jgi:hypothetical protein
MCGIDLTYIERTMKEYHVEDSSEILMVDGVYWKENGRDRTTISRLE